MLRSVIVAQIMHDKFVSAAGIADNELALQEATRSSKRIDKSRATRRPRPFRELTATIRLRLASVFTLFFPNELLPQFLRNALHKKKRKKKERVRA